MNNYAFDLINEEAGTMEVSIDNHEPPAERANPLTVFSNAVENALRRVNHLFTLTKIERFQAGIDTSGEGREDKSFYE